MPGTSSSGRRPSLIPSRKVEFKFPLDLLEAVDARLFDPVSGKAGYGRRQALVTRLLHEWVERTPVSPIALDALREASEAPTMSLDDLLAYTTPD